MATSKVYAVEYLLDRYNPPTMVSLHRTECGALVAWNLKTQDVQLSESRPVLWELRSGATNPWGWTEIWVGRVYSARSKVYRDTHFVGIKELELND